MSKTTVTLPHNHIHKIRYFHARLMAQLLVVFISLTVMVQRLAMTYGNPEISTATIELTFISLPFALTLALIVILKYLLYKRLGTRILKYSQIIDAIFCITFTADWIILLRAQLVQCKHPGPITFSLSGIVGFTSFSWRTLLQILITQQWQLRLLAPVSAYIYVLWFSVANQPDLTCFILLRGILQIVYVISIFYLEHKLNFMVLIGNMQQQQWLQLNDYILSNIPENIAIVDLNGKWSFISESFRRLIRYRTQSEEIQQFLRSIIEIQYQQPENQISESGESIMEILPTEKLSDFTLGDNKLEAQTIPSLEELINIFGNLITKGLIKEKNLQVFNGKFKRENELQERSFQISLSFINQHPNKYILLIIRDTTERDLVLTLEGNIKYKDQLLTTISHELRTPLNGNINLLEAVIKSNDIGDKVKENFLVPAVKSSKFLLYLINDILDMSQIKVQKLRLVFQEASLRETFANAVHLLELHAKKKGIELESIIHSDIPESLCTDHARLSQILLNLMNNSIKFTQKGKIKLSAWLLKDTDHIQVSITDTGIGMSKEDVNKLFKDFTQIECQNREQINPRGVGLGLKIANDLAKLLGPRGNKGIIVKSTMNKGSTFAFVLENKENGLKSQDKLETKEDYNEDRSLLVPNEFYASIESSLGIKAAKVNSVKSLIGLDKAESPSINTLSQCSCAKILVVDDDPFNIMAYEAILNSLAVKYECVYSGRNAIDKMLNKMRYPCSVNCNPYNIVFMDEEMPGMTGREVVKEISRLQSQNLLPDMNIIGCTAHSDGEEIEKFLRAGIKEYTPKPISFNNIKIILEKYLS